MPTAIETQSNIPIWRPSTTTKQSFNRISQATKPVVHPIPITPARKIISNQKLAPKLDHDKDYEVTILELRPFGKQPIVNFGEVPVGSNSINYLVVRNFMDSRQQLFVRTFPKPDSGFNIDATELLLSPRTQIYVAISWTPSAEGSVRESITLQDANRRPLRIVIIGTAIRPRKIVPKSTRLEQPKNTVTKMVRALRQNNQRMLTPKARRLMGRDTAINSPLRKLIHQTTRRDSGQFVAKVVRHNIQVDQQAAIKVQSYMRMILAKRAVQQLRAKHEAAKKLQAFFKLFVARQKLHKLRRQREAIIRIQSVMRSVLARRKMMELKRRKEAAIRIQSMIRMVLARRESEELRARRDAAIKIQSYVRMIMIRNAYRQLRARNEAIIRIQSFFRMIIARRHLGALHERRSLVIRLQSMFRMIIAKRELGEMRKRRDAAIRIQSMVRMRLARRMLDELRRQRDAATRIQSIVRMFLARRKLADLRERRDAATRIQSVMRMILAQKEAEKLRKRRNAVIKIQTYMRLVLAVRMAREMKIKRERMIKATIGLQTHCRAYLVRQRLRRSIEALTRIQIRAVKEQFATMM